MVSILLINPPRDHMVHIDLPNFVDLGEISSFPPIGLMYLAQAVRQDLPDTEIEILDSVVEKMSHEDIAAYVKRKRPDIVGITSFTYTFYDVLLTARLIKEAIPETHVTVGGPHMYLFPHETMSHSVFDSGVVGDGELIIIELCRAVKEKRPPRPMDGLLYRTGEVVIGQGIAQVTELNSVEVPAIDLIPTKKYFSTIGKGKAVGTICTSRGCPFHCTFCQVPHTPYRMRSVSNVLDEVEAYLKLGVDDFFFFDDLFNISKKRVVEFSEEVLARKLDISWMFRGRVDQIDEETARIAHKAGCHTISVGVESATNSGLKAIRKGITIEQAFAAVRAIRRAGVSCSTNWIIGFPEHKTIADLDNLLDVAIHMNADYAQFSVLQCLPGSELYDMAVAQNGIDQDAWKNYTLHPVKRFSPPIWEHALTSQELYEFYAKAYRKYYLRPRLIFREALRIRTMAELINKAKSFFSVFFG